MSRTLCTEWSHPEFDQKLVIPGNAAETIDLAKQYIEGNPQFLESAEKHYTDEELENMGEFEG